MLFYSLIILILAASLFLFVYQRRKRKRPRFQREVPLVSFTKEPESVDADATEQSPYDPNLVILQINAFPGKSYMGYELHQALLSVGLSFGDKSIFHRYADGDESKTLFSLAAATSSGSFSIEDMGSFKCSGLLLFMRLDPRRKLMKAFDLMLDTARQLTEELGGEICDDLQNLINAEAIKRLREKICMVETNNLYTSDLLDNLD